MDLVVRDANAADAAALCSIYNHYIEHSTVSFELEPLDERAMSERIDAYTPALPWLIACHGSEVIGYAFAAPWKPRAAYRYTVESSVYLAPEWQGHGLGRPLYRELLEQLRGLGLHSVIGSIALPNDASVHLHESLGFVHVGRLSEAGFKFGRWIDMGYWQRKF